MTSAAPLDNINADIKADLVALVASATVSIGRDGRGSGTVIAPGFVLTNAHNLHDRSTEVGFADGRRVQGTVAGADPDGDLAVLAVDTGDAVPLEWSDEAPRVGQAVVAGSAGGRRHRFTVGHVSAAGQAFRSGGGRLVEDAVEHTVPLPRGSSGGPLVSLDGRLLGVNTHRLGHRFYLARPGDASLRARIDGLRSGESVRRRRLGVALAPNEVATRLRQTVGLDARDGLLVRGVAEGSPAAASGLREGDLIVTVGGTPTATIDDLGRAIDAAEATVVIGVVRGAEELSLEVTFESSEA